MENGNEEKDSDSYCAEGPAKDLYKVFKAHNDYFVGGGGGVGACWEVRPKVTSSKPALSSLSLSGWFVVQEEKKIKVSARRVFMVLVGCG